MNLIRIGKIDIFISKFDKMRSQTHPKSAVVSADDDAPGVGEGLGDEPLVGVDDILVGALVRLRCEEVLLAVRFPQYHDYAAKTWRMIPYVF